LRSLRRVDRVRCICYGGFVEYVGNYQEITTTLRLEGDLREGRCMSIYGDRPETAARWSCDLVYYARLCREGNCLTCFTLVMRRVFMVLLMYLGCWILLVPIRDPK
jgi:hypothetical protein